MFPRLGIAEAKLMKNDQEKLITLTRDWLEKVVIGLDLCPFARAPMEEGKIEIQAGKLESIDRRVQEMLENLNAGLYETSLLILDEEIDFMDFFQLVGGLEESLEDAGLGDHFQIVTFHPRFVFEGLEPDDLANLVNRSPYPTIHFLKVSSMKALNLSPKQGEEISARNERLLKSLPASDLEELFPWNKASHWP